MTDDKGAVTTQPVTVNVTGTNDAPVITGGAATGAVQEDGVQSATGTLTATDVDHGATPDLDGGGRNCAAAWRTTTS